MRSVTKTNLKGGVSEGNHDLISIGFNKFRNFSDSIPPPQKETEYEKYTTLYNIRLYILQLQIKFPSAKPPTC
jgi:hypothetical protein